MTGLGLCWTLLETVEKIADRHGVKGRAEVALGRDLDMNPKLTIDWKTPTGAVFRAAMRLDSRFSVTDTIPSGLLADLAKSFEAKILEVKRKVN